MIQTVLGLHMQEPHQWKGAIVDKIQKNEGCTDPTGHAAWESDNGAKLKTALHLLIDDKYLSGPQVKHTLQAFTLKSKRLHSLLLVPHQTLPFQWTYSHRSLQGQETTKVWTTAMGWKALLGSFYPHYTTGAEGWLPNSLFSAQMNITG